MTDREASRRRRGRIRRIAAWLIGIGALLLLPIGLVAALGINLIDGMPLAQCGSLIDPAPVPPGILGDACAQYLGEHLAVVVGLGVVAVALAVTGIVVLLRNPARLGF